MVKEINILGSKWVIKEQSESENELLDCRDGYCDWTIKEIVVRREIDGTLQDMNAYIKSVIRHEIIHAFLYESGLDSSCSVIGSWAKNEEMVDWIAIQGQKIYNVWKEADALD